MKDEKGGDWKNRQCLKKSDFRGQKKIRHYLKGDIKI